MTLGVNLLSPERIGFKSQLSSYEQQLRQIASSQQSLPEVEFITNTVLGHILLLDGKNEEVIKLSASCNEIANTTGSYSFKYSNVASIKYSAILGTAYEATGQFDNAIQIYESAAKIINDSIAASPEALLWAEQLYYRFSMLATSFAWDNSRLTLAALRGYQRISDLLSTTPGVRKYYSYANGLERRINVLNMHFAYSSALLQNNSGEEIDPGTKQEVKSMSDLFEKMLFESVEASKSSDSNAPIEQFIETMMTNWRKTMTFSKHLDRVYKPEDVSETVRMLNLLRRAAIKTFHSCAILRHLIFVLAALGHYDEALTAFQVYTDYQEKARVQQQKTEESRKLAPTELSGSAAVKPLHSGDDDKSVVRVFTKVIDILDQIKGDGLKAKETADTLRGWLGKDDSEEVDLSASSGVNAHSRNKSIASVKTTETANGLAAVWASIARAYCLFGFQAPTSEEREHVFRSATSSFETCISYSPTDAQVYADYGLFLARNSKISKALEIVRKGLLVDNSNYACWHLMALVLTSMGEHEKGLNAITNTINLISQRQKELTTEERKCFLQMKITQIAIVEAINGTERALELIPEVFCMFGELFPGSREPEKSSNTKPLSPTSPKKSSSDKSSADGKLALKPTSSRISIRRFAPGSHFFKSHTKHASIDQAKSGVAPVPPLPDYAPNGPNNLKRSATTKAVSSLKPVNEVTQKYELSKLWLWTAGLYRRSGLFHECEESILEAESLVGPSVASHVALGLLICQRRPLHALNEYETALELDPNNLDAIIAMGELILERVKNNEKLKRKKKERQEKIKLAAERERMLDSSNGAPFLKDPFGEELSGPGHNVTGNNVSAAQKSNEKTLSYYESDEEDEDNLDEDDEFFDLSRESSFNSVRPEEKSKSQSNNFSNETNEPDTGVSLTQRGKSFDALFISDADERATIARIMQLLQITVDAGYGFNSSEAWYILAQFLENAGDKEAAIQAMWKSVGLEETRSVRKWTVCQWGL